MGNNAKCDYCKNKSMNKRIIEHGDSNSGLDARITHGELVVSGYYDGFVGIEPAKVKIYYCPICGSEVRR